jgi:hypothetical protein
MWHDERARKQPLWPNDFERFLTRATIAINREIIVKAGRFKDAETFHHCKACSIHNGKRLIAERITNSPGHLEIGSHYDFDIYPALPNPRPKSFGRDLPIPAV